MVDIPGGTYRVGGAIGGSLPAPEREVTLRPFAIDVTEVSVAQYNACVRSGACTRADGGAFCNGDNADRLDHPINCVLRTQATSYCRWLGKRLPTEDEWEVAGRGTDGRPMPWASGSSHGRPCDASGAQRPTFESYSGTCPVGASPGDASPFGVLDLAANVGEFTSSTAPSGEPITRGGSWHHSVLPMLYDRIPATPDTTSVGVGFRCAR